MYRNSIPNKEKIKVMQAYENGKSIEYRDSTTEWEWEDANTPVWDWWECEYRIKTRQFWINKYRDTNGKIRYYVHETEKDANAFTGVKMEMIHVVEEI